MHSRSSAVITVAVLLSGCMPSSPPMQGRQLVPPRAGIQVGSLYYVREAPTDELSRPARLEALCEVSLERHGVRPSAVEPAADIDFARSLEASGALSGLQGAFGAVGLNGSFSDYYEYKLTNARYVHISALEAQKLFDRRAFQSDCAGWRKAIGRNSWGKYQVVGVTTGDLTFGPKREISLGGEVSAKIAGLTPTVKATLKASGHSVTSGKGLVVSFDPIRRD